MDINRKCTLPRVIILAVRSLLLVVACDNHDGPGPDTPAEEVPLSFSASIEKTGIAQSKTIITPTADFTRNSYFFGMSLTKSENRGETFKGSLDITATIERPNSSTQWNQYFIDSSDSVIVAPVGPESKVSKVVTYYPSVLSTTKDVYTDGVPFGFFSKTDLKQTGLLYNTSTIYPFVPSGDPVATIPLSFRRAYTWIVLDIAEHVGKGPEFTLSSVSLDSLGGSWIKNQGTTDPETGLAKNGATTGPIDIMITPIAVLSTTQALAYEFLVPSFIDTKVSDGGIALVLNVNGINELFTLDRIHLNRSDDGESLNLGQEYRDTYDLVYNNSALSLNIQNWGSGVADGDSGGNIMPPRNGNYKWMNLNQYCRPSAVKSGDSWQTTCSPKTTYLTTGVHPFEDYLTTVAYGGSGAYVFVNIPDSTKRSIDGLKITDNINVHKNKKTYPVIQITRNNISTVPVPWGDISGQLVAKELRRKYNGGDFHNWRSSRASELRAVLVLVSANGSDLSDLNFDDQSRNKPYRIDTEVSESEAWGMYIDYTGSIVDTKLVLSPYDKEMTVSMRCVRDAS